MRRSTSAYVDHWARLSLLAPAALTFFALAATTCERTVWRGSFDLAEEQEGVSPELALPVTWLGGLRIEARAQLPVNRWAAYQLNLVDSSDTPLLELTKEAWRESGVWREGGESGTWQESDTTLSWDLRPGKDEKVKLEVAVLETGVSYDVSADPRQVAADTGTEKFSVPINVSIRAGVTDGRLLALAIFLSAAFSLLAYYVAGHRGQPVIVELNSDSEVQGRATCGGPDRLVMVSIAGKVDETAPLNMQVRLIARDEAGVTWYDQSHPTEVNFRKEDGEIEDGRFSRRLYFELPRRTSWGMFVEVTPDNPMEEVKLIVRDGASTRGSVELEPIQGAA